MHDTHDAGAGPSEGVATELPNVGVRLVQVFTAPSALFDRLKERPVWIGAVVTIIVIGLVVQAFIPEQLVREMLLARLPGDASPDQVRATEQAAGVANVMRWVGTVAFPPVFFAVLAGFLLLIYNVLMGGEAAFKQLYSISAHANLIGAVARLRSSSCTASRRTPISSGQSADSSPFRWCWPGIPSRPYCRFTCWCRGSIRKRTGTDS
jgi:hypothetical protein